MDVMCKVAEWLIDIDENGDTKRDRLNIVNGVFILIYIMLALIVMYKLILAEDFDAKDSLDYSVIIFSSFNVHLWIYLARRFYLGLNGKDGLVRKIGSVEPYKQIWNESKCWFYPCKIKEHSLFQKLVKILFFIMWIFTASIIAILTYHLRYSFGGMAGNNDCFKVWLGLFLYLVSMALNLFSYFTCVAFTALMRKLANNAEEIKFNYRKPSNTFEYQQLLQTSSRIAIAFFFSSALYVIQCVFVVWINKTYRINDEYDYIYMSIIMVCVLVLCIFSFFLFFILPKAFLSRMLRKWKFLAIENHPKGREYRYISLKQQAEIEMIYSDHMPLIRLEAITAAIAVAIDVASVIITIKS